MTDFFRFWWALLYWNTRKSWWRWRGRVGAAPCQHPSDSGRPLETSCEACHAWRRPERFRRVCPLLVRQGRSWRCSAAREDVRPFWGRAIGCWAALAVAGYLAAAAAAWLVLRQVGYQQLAYADFFSPHFRRLFRAAQADLYRHRAEEAFAAGNLRGALLALSIAYARGPEDWVTGLQFARTLQAAQQYPLGDQVFERLLRDHPARTDETALAWADALRDRGDWGQLVSLAAGRVAAGSPAAGAWMRLLVFALRQLPEPEFPRAVEGAATRLTGPLAAVVRIEPLRRAGDHAAVRAALAGLRGGADPFVAEYFIEELARAGDLSGASIALAGFADVLGPFHFNLLGARLAALQDQQALAEVAFGNLLVPPVRPDQLDFACAELIRHPSAARLRLAIDAYAREPALREQPAPLVGLIAAAAVVADPAQLALLQGWAAAHPALGRIDLGEFSRFVAGRDSGLSLRAALAGYPVPREVALAVIERRGRG